MTHILRPAAAIQAGKTVPKTPWRYTRKSSVAKGDRSRTQARPRSGRKMLSVDLYNALNTGAILTYNNTYAPPTATAPSVYEQPLRVATPLMVRFTAEFSF
ncbi:MAG TPA: hypothetical protein VFB92_13455 [Vicinamibacterales bacterium]|nr:hypothetical protein [Vicinamibacterales bacterium]